MQCVLPNTILKKHPFKHNTQSVLPNMMLCVLPNIKLPYARHHKPLLIRSRSWIQAIHKDRIFWKNLLKNKEMVFGNGVKNIQAAAYNGARTVFSFFTWKIKIINFKESDFCKLLRLCAISALQISKKHFATFDFFCINKACVNCGKENATTLTWLQWHIRFSTSSLNAISGDTV